MMVQVISINNLGQTNQPTIYHVSNDQKDIAGKSMYISFQLNILNNVFHSGALIDSGSEGNLIELSYLQRMTNLTKKELLKKIEQPQYLFEDFSTNDIEVVGQLNMIVTSTLTNVSYNIPACVYKTTASKTTCPIIFGQPALAITKMILNYSVCPPTSNNQFFSKFCSQNDLKIVRGHIKNLKPKMATKIKFLLPQPFFAKLNEKIMIEANFTYITNDEFVEILTTTTPVMHNTNDGFFAEALVINQSSSNYTGYTSLLI